MSKDKSTATYTALAQEDPAAANFSDQSPELQDQQVQAASWAWIYILCIANFGLSGAWALEFAITTPYFEKGLNSGAVLSHGVWIVGPLSGLIVAPIVGTLSDRCTSRFGRRRPFIIAGLVATAVGMLTFSNAPQLASIAFPSGTDAHHITAIVIAIVSFCVLDLAINTTMWPVRALQGDLIPKSQQHSLQSASIVMGSFGDLAANGLVHAFEEPVMHIRLSFLVAAMVYSCTVLVLIVVGKEVAVRPDDPAIQTARRQSLNIFEYLRGLPAWMWRVGGTYGLGFFTLFCCMPNASNWLGSSVFGGDPNAPDSSAKAKAYENGVNIYSQAGLLRAFVQIVFSAVYPSLLKFVTAGQLMGLCFGVFGILVAIFSDTKSVNIARLIVVMMAFPMAAHFTLPVGLTVENSDESNRGLYLGALNCFAVIPQLIDTTYTGYVSRAFGEAMVMKIGAAWGILTAISAFVYMRIN